MHEGINPELYRRRFEALVRCSTSGWCFVDSSWRIVWHNDTLNDLIDPERSRGQNSLRGVRIQRIFEQAEDFRSFTLAVEHDLEVETRSTTEYRLRRIDGAPWWANVSVARDDSPMGLEYAIEFIETTQMHELRDRVNDRSSIQSHILRNVADLIVRLDVRGRIVFVNPSAERIFRVGTDFADHVAPEDRDSLDHLYKVPDHDETGMLQIRVRLRDRGEDEAWLSGAVRHLLREDGSLEGVHLTLRDVTVEARTRRIVEEAGLTEREMQILYLLMDGYTNLNIATILGISENGVKFHVKNIFRKTGVSSRAELLSRAIPSKARSAPPDSRH